MDQNRHPAGAAEKRGGQFAATPRIESPVSLTGTGRALTADAEIANTHPVMVDSIAKAGLTGTLTTDGETITYTVPGGEHSFSIEPGEEYTLIRANQMPLQSAGLDDEYDELASTAPETTGTDLATLTWISQTRSACTLNVDGGHATLGDFRVERNDDGSPRIEMIIDTVNGDVADITYQPATGKAWIFTAHGEQTDDVDSVLARFDGLEELMASTGLDAPGETTSDRLRWHMDRSFADAAAKPDAPAWAATYPHVAD
ncbi:hypothetical protein V6N00_13340 [Tersicoccus sp. MR15.9]|uniref:hypothetical protein n=1 Tax=Tersicoccus mangrovi TaxID=3121635 RepID=UPI002FE5726E